MAEHEDVVGDALERLERSEEISGPVSKAARLTRRTALTGATAGIAAVLLDACGSSANGVTTSSRAATDTSAAGSIFGVKAGYRFTFVSHATTNTYFTPTISGIQDACQLLGCSYQWVGSASSNVPQMAAAINTAISAGVDGIATSLISTALAAPVDAAIAAGIPVVSYNSDEPGTGRLAYIGQDLTLSGHAMGDAIRSLIPGGGRITVFVATPGSGNLQPRLNGLRRALRGSNVTVESQASGVAQPQELTTVEAFVGNNLTSYDGYFALDGGSTAAVALALQKYNLKGKVFGGGFDLLPETQQLLDDSTIQFAIDQQPYLQGFVATLELFLHRASQGLTGTADVNTGVKLRYPGTVKQYAQTTSRYEGTGTSAGVQTSP